MGRLYTAVIEEAALATATDLMRILAPTDAIVLLHSVTVTTDAAAADTMNIQMHRATGGGTAAVTPRPLQLGDAAFGGTVHDLTGTTDTTEGDIVITEFVDVRAGFYWTPPPEERIIISPSGIFAIRSDLTITSVVARMTVVLEEIGG